MAAPAVAVAAKKVLVALVSDKKGRKFLMTIIGIVIGIVLAPLCILMGLSQTDLSIDMEQFEQVVQANMSEEQVLALEAMEETMISIENEMTTAGYSALRVREAQVLYVLALSDFATDSDFVSKLVGCFSEEQTDVQLIENVNSTFGTEISVEEFTNLMGTMRSTYIDASDYVDLSNKNNLDLVTWAKNASNAQWGYVYGMFGTVLDEDMLAYKKNQYPEDVNPYEEFIRENWMGKRCADCVGLIKGYGWYNPESGEVEYGSNGMADVDAGGMYDAATEKGVLSTMPDIPGLAVWQQGHIGIYVGDGKVVEAMTTTVGVVTTDLHNRGWTHWLKIPYINYIEETESTTN